MKNKLRNLSGLAFFGVMLLTANITFAQTSADSTTTTTVPAGTSAEFSSGDTAPVVKKASLANPAKDYDDNGNRLSNKTLNSGSPATVYYDKDGNKIIATTTVEKTAITSAGTISQFSPDTIVVKTTTSADPISYSYTKTTAYVDQNGNPVAMETVKSGMPVTVYYDMDGDKMVATKIIVRKTVVSTTINKQKT